MNKHEVLKQYFGHTEFRYGQSELIDAILTGRDSFGIMPTGAGKSICYQVPAIMLSGITLVVSPLISLMKDQVSALIQAGVKAAYINSTLSYRQYAEAIRRAMDGAYKIIYVAPERLVSDDLFKLAEQNEISMITVDEAHCVSQWGQDFRPSYLKILDFISKLPYRPIISAFTATATTQVRDDVVNILQLNNPAIVTTGFDRPNLYFEVQKPKNKFAALISILEKFRGRSGIIYCSTRKTVEEVCSDLNNQGYAATRYHAGLEESERTRNQDSFIYDRKAIMVATNAFGMGIDKSNVSFVVHYNMPKDLESYYQEAGRAGRDGEPADCILLYSGQDVRLNQFLIENSSDESNELDAEVLEQKKKKDRERLKAITFYCATDGCLREYILRYFGESSPHFCGNCSNCRSNFEWTDITVEAQKIVSCVYRIEQRNKSFGKNMLADILHGSKNERILRLSMDTISTYGIMSEISVHRIRTMIDYLIDKGYLELTNDEYAVVCTTDKSLEVVRDKKPLQMKLVKEAEKVISAKKENVHIENEELFYELKKLRSKLAEDANVPAYVIFTDATLHDMCAKLPTTTDELLTVSGVGKVKQERFGWLFVNAIQKYQKNHLEYKNKHSPHIYAYERPR